ncbi:hypothetical protein N7532_005321 [Penicillium argentinense]|uniref:Uncharacterized protein n=1 Tax=Penicillium argentinense TaxID=1131581 RepID=A0A9W9FDZ4_9EURO|nr:uncharacterized protein N7532_005321 [Penicillium argentinense]KAJ5098320.1 hypothetical protein N7532_005321 [Penicillium argentinense]
MAPPDLQVNSLYILLFNRNDPPQPNDFHWGLYLHQNPVSGGTKYHIKTVGPGWIPDHGTTAAIMKEFLLVGLLRIADVPRTFIPISIGSFDRSMGISITRLRRVECGF